jgi:phage-related protein
MNWVVEVLNEAVENELEVLPFKIKAKMSTIIKMVEKYGIDNLPRSYSKHIEDKIWEFRAKAKEGIGRALYVTVSGKRVIILHAFVKKSDKIPTPNLDVARKRLKEVE